MPDDKGSAAAGVGGDPKGGNPWRTRTPSLPADPMGELRWTSPMKKPRPVGDTRGVSPNKKGAISSVGCLNLAGLHQPDQAL